MPDTMIERVARALWDEHRDAMTWHEFDGWLKGMRWDDVGNHDVTKDVAAQMRSAARAAIAALMEPTDGMVRAGVDYRLRTSLHGDNDWPTDTRRLLGVMLTAALEETPDA
jgi:hypothetical protein